MRIALLQHQRIFHVVTKKLKNVERMKGIVILIVIAKQVSSVALIIVQVVSHQHMTAATKSQVQGGRKQIILVEALNTNILSIDFLVSH